jgi:hypothetical protein
MPSFAGAVHLPRPQRWKEPMKLDRGRFHTRMPGPQWICLARVRFFERLRSNVRRLGSRLVRDNQFQIKRLMGTIGRGSQFPGN